jgi:hypothetical protein
MTKDTHGMTQATGEVKRDATPLPDWSGLRFDCRGPLLHEPLKQEAGETVAYGTGIHYQVSPTQVALIINRRMTHVAVTDFENGYDGLVFERLEEIRPERAYPLARNTKGVHPRSGAALTLVHHSPQGGFVPLGAKLADGRPHPHAGTGFGLGTIHGYPADNSVSGAHVAADLVSYFHLTQWVFDGERLVAASVEAVKHEEVLPGWYVVERGLGPGVADGEDFLFGIVAGRETEQSRAHREMLKKAGKKEHIASTGPMGECYSAGISRWRRVEGKWKAVDFVSVPGYLPDMAFEPSVVRDGDGSLLFSVRGKGSNAAPGEKEFGLENTFEHFRVCRSRDNGKTWERVVHLKEMRSPSPVTIQKTAQGRVFLAANPWRPMEQDAQGKNIPKTMKREVLSLWPLTEDRTGVGKPALVLDAKARLGAARPFPMPGKPNYWYADHPLGGVYRLADGQWHTLMTFRLSDAALTAGGAGAAEAAGLWVVEIFEDSGEAAPRAWQF